MENNENNVYQAPEAEVIDRSLHDEPQLASRWSRLFAAIIDSIVIMVFVVPLQYLTGGYDNLGAEVGLMDNLGYNLVMGLVYILIYAAINFKLLRTKGQTIGKMLIGTQIVDIDGKTLASDSALITRYSFYLGISIVPVVGGFIALVNILFIFSQKKTCLHDVFAKTYVIKKV